MADKTTKWILELVDEVVAPLKNIEREAKLATDIGEDLGDSFEDVSDDIKGTGKASNETADDFLSMFDDFGSADFLGIQGGFKGITNNIHGMTKAGLAFIATPLGVTLAGLAIVGAIATDFVKYNEAAREANVLTAQMTQLSGDALSDARVRGKVIEETFGTDFKDTLELAKNNVQAFEITYDEALDNIANGLVRGGAANDEYLSSMREYPRLFASAGYSMNEFQRIVDAGFDMGIYADKLPDAVKEFGLSVTEQTESSKAALESAFGKKFTDDLFKNIENGSITQKQALQDIAKETERVGVNTRDAQVLTADLFRGAGEDAGGFLAIIEGVNTALNNEEEALSGVETQLNKVYQATQEFRDAQKEALESDTYTAFAQEMELFWLQIKTYYYDAIIWAGDWFNATTKFYTQIVAAVVSVPSVIKESFLNITDDLTQLIGTFISAGDIIKNALSGNWDEARAGFSAFKEDLKEDLKNLGADIAITPGVSLVNKALEAGEDVDAYRDGLAYYSKSTDSKKQARLGGTTPEGETDTPVGGPKTKTAGTGSGGSAGKNITMTLNIVQNFAVNSKLNIEEVASETVRLINDRLRDAVITTAG